jgi:general secretion pathway protein A
LQSFLLGQPEFRITLQSEEMQQLKQRVIASYHLGAMDMSETCAYIQHRLDMVGWKNDPRISDDAYQRIHDYTGGIPRKINTLSDRLLLLGFLSEKHDFSAAEVQEVIDDLGQEVAYSTTPTSSVKVGHSNQATAVAEVEVALMGLEEKVESMERTLNRMLAMMRKLLHTVGESQAKPGKNHA